MRNNRTIPMYSIILILEIVLCIELNDSANIQNLDSIASDVEINLYLSSDPDFPYDLNFDTIQNAPIIKNISTKIIIHGWLDDSDNIWVLSMKDKYFLNGPTNVIIVNWGAYANMGYIYAHKKTEAVAEYVSDIIASLFRRDKLNINDTHIVGFDLGAHLAGFIGKNLQRNANQMLDRITGLDPSRTFYEYFLPVSSKKRLAKTDADFVDVIHTCAGNLGMSSSIGHLDFFPNGGTYKQPGCDLILQVTCSHHRAYKFYMESITSQHFVSTKCKSWSHFKKNKCLNGEKSVMGLHLNASTTGKYYLRTNGKTPYALG